MEGINLIYFNEGERLREEKKEEKRGRKRERKQLLKKNKKKILIEAKGVIVRGL